MNNYSSRKSNILSNALWNIAHTHFKKICIIGIMLAAILFLLVFGGFSSAGRDSSVEATTVKEKKYVSVQVHYGDTLWSLAERYGEEYEDPSVFIDDVKQFNELHGDTIKAGAYLFIPVYR